MGPFTYTWHYTLDDDDSDEEEGSDDDSAASDETEKRPAGYSNLAERFHTVSVNIKPNELLNYMTKSAIDARPGVDAYSGFAIPLALAARENDLEAFNHIADVSIYVGMESDVEETDSV